MDGANGRAGGGGLERGGHEQAIGVVERPKALFGGALGVRAADEEVGMAALDGRAVGGADGVGVTVGRHPQQSGGFKTALPQILGFRVWHNGYVYASVP